MDRTPCLCVRARCAVLACAAWKTTGLSPRAKNSRHAESSSRQQTQPFAASVSAASSSTRRRRQPHSSSGWWQQWLWLHKDQEASQKLTGAAADAPPLVRLLKLLALLRVGQVGKQHHGAASMQPCPQQQKQRRHASHQLLTLSMQALRSLRPPVLPPMHHCHSTQPHPCCRTHTLPFLSPPLFAPIRPPRTDPLYGGFPGPGCSGTQCPGGQTAHQGSSGGAAGAWRGPPPPQLAGRAGPTRPACTLHGEGCRQQHW